jgi:hypothetical protein
LGTAGPAVVAGALLLLYRVTMALLIGLGPLFILCLIFKATQDLFRRWLMYLLGTLFSMATLYWAVSLAMQLSTRVAAALWSSSLVNTALLGDTSESLSSQAMQQGGVGLILTVLIITTPPMAAMLFNGALGNFNPLSVFGAGGGMGTGRRRQPSPATSYVPSAPHAGSSGGHVQADVSLPHRAHSGVAAQRDEIKRLPLSDEAMAAAAYGDPRYWTAQVGPAAPGTQALGPEAPSDAPSATNESQQIPQTVLPARSSDDVSVSYATGVDRSSITDSAELVLREICARADISSVTISSGARTAESQVNAMYKNASDNLVRERRLYGTAGQQVLDAYEQAVAAGHSEQEVKAAMLDRLNAVGPGNVSSHISQGPDVSTFDVAPSSLQSKEAIERFESEVQADPRVSRYFAPPPDKGFHLEIRN